RDRAAVGVAADRHYYLRPLAGAERLYHLVGYRDACGVVAYEHGGELHGPDSSASATPTTQTRAPSAARTGVVSAAGAVARRGRRSALDARVVGRGENRPGA